jgi:hypothetical protein
LPFWTLGFLERLKTATRAVLPEGVGKNQSKAQRAEQKNEKFQKKLTPRPQNNLTIFPCRKRPTFFNKIAQVHRKVRPRRLVRCSFSEDGSLSGAKAGPPYYGERLFTPP